MIEITAEPVKSDTLVAAHDPEIEAMMKAGVHLGHAKGKNHPAMAPYLFGIRNTVSIIDLTRTKDKLAEAIFFLKGIAARGGIILFVGTRPAARGIVKEWAERIKLPYFTDRWIGGTLTNYKVISKRVAEMKRLEEEQASGGFEKYTKRERMRKEEEILRLRRNFDGLRTLLRLPDAVFVVDITHDTTAVREARRMHIPVVALVDTNADIRLADIPIPANDNALSAVRYMIGKIGEAIEEGMRERRESEAGAPAEAI